MSVLKINTDGGSRGNPGPAAAGIVIYDDQHQIHQFSQYLGVTTNNQAEYQAVSLALDYLISQPQLVSLYSSVEFILDSELVVRQINGQYRVKHPDLIPIYQNIIIKLSQFSIPFVFIHVKRHLNYDADKILNQELDSHS
jgi:ribonuclease HI